MRESNHTPGEWVIEPRRTVVASGKRGLLVAQIATGSVSSAFGGSFCIDEAEAQANVRLIAAAPDLLAALKDMLPEENMNEKHLRPDFETCERARAAIAKAEGRQ